MNGRTNVPEGMPRPTGQEGYVLLEAIWEHFTEHHYWPTFDDIDRKLYAQKLQFEDVVQQLCPALLLGLAPDLSQLPHGSQILILTLAGAANCSYTGPVIDEFISLVRKAAGMEPAWLPSDRGELPWMQPGDMARNLPARSKAAKILRQNTFEAAALGQHEICFRGGSIEPDTLDWSLNFDRGIRPFADVQTLEDYWRIGERVLGPERSEADNRPFSIQPAPHNLAAWPPGTPAIPAPAEESPKTLTVECVLHPLIAKVAAERYAQGSYNDAVMSAYRAVEYRVQTLLGSRAVGERLMSDALAGDSPKIKVTRSTSPGSLDSERKGMHFLFMGAVGALRNPRAHGPDEADDRDEADEMLAFASFLMRRLDIEEAEREKAADAEAESAQ
ncbi:TIGR02391 family protein [Streptomyces sp. NPDC001222]|uniref:TIGR02391 family protein n=1 Tax=Streptomyces sp. NPDC001222 TaxID=3364548 RepID=UPI00368EF055